MAGKLAAASVIERMQNEVEVIDHTDIQRFAREAASRFETGWENVMQALRKCPEYRNFRSARYKLSARDELKLECIVEYLLSHREFVQKKDLPDIVKQIFDVDVSVKWAKRFVRRSKLLKIESGKIITHARSKAPSKGDLFWFMAHMNHLLEAYPSMKSSTILNMDETRVAVQRDGNIPSGFICGTKIPGGNVAIRTEQICCTVVPFVCANGECVVVYIVLRQDEWEGDKNPRFVTIVDSEHRSRQSKRKQGVGWIYRYVLTPTSYLDKAAFREMMLDFAKIWDRHHKTFAYVMMDRCSTHVDEKVIEELFDVNVRVILLPANTTHFAQPLDQEPLGEFQRQFGRLVWEKVDFIDKACPEHPKPTVAFFSALYDASRTAFSKKLIVAGFRTAGIWPWNSQNFAQIVNKYSIDQAANRLEQHVVKSTTLSKEVQTRFLEKRRAKGKKEIEQREVSRGMYRMRKPFGFDEFKGYTGIRFQSVEQKKKDIAEDIMAKKQEKKRARERIREQSKVAKRQKLVHQKKVVLCRFCKTANRKRVYCDTCNIFSICVQCLASENFCEVYRKHCDDCKQCVVLKE